MIPTVVHYKASQTLAEVYGFCLISNFWWENEVVGMVERNMERNGEKWREMWREMERNGASEMTEDAGQRGGNHLLTTRSQSLGDFLSCQISTSFPQTVTVTVTVTVIHHFINSPFCQVSPRHSWHPRYHSSNPPKPPKPPTTRVTVGQHGQVTLWPGTPGRYCRSTDTLHSCTALYCTAVRCVALHCTVLHCSALHCSAL